MIRPYQYLTYQLKEEDKGLLASQVSRSVCHYILVLITVGGDTCFQSQCGIYQYISSGVGHIVTYRRSGLARLRLNIARAMGGGGGAAL